VEIISKYLKTQIVDKEKNAKNASKCHRPLQILISKDIDIIKCQSN
jgi:hypothetical protein